MYKTASALALAVTISVATAQADGMKKDSMMPQPDMASEMAADQGMADKMPDPMMKASEMKPETMMKASEMKPETMMQPKAMADRMKSGQAMDAAMKTDNMLKDKQ